MKKESMTQFYRWLKCKAEDFLCIENESTIWSDCSIGKRNFDMKSEWTTFPKTHFTLKLAKKRYCYLINATIWWPKRDALYVMQREKKREKSNGLWIMQFSPTSHRRNRNCIVHVWLKMKMRKETDDGHGVKVLASKAPIKMHLKTMHASDKKSKVKLTLLE